MRSGPMPDPSVLPDINGADCVPVFIVLSIATSLTLY
jgi:hypothetical protein